MVLINKAVNEVTLKLVYYGPGLCGKTTNLEKIYGNPKLENKGKMISMSTETDRTLFFDFMPMELGTINGQKIRVQLYTVPGQVFYDATRKLVLRGADGVVFVADSQPSMRDSNIDSLENLKTNLRINRIDPEKVALIYQLNKRDLPTVATVEEMTSYMNTGTAPVVEAAALQGVGVTATLRTAVSRILENLKNNVDITLYEEQPLKSPEMLVRSGVTSSSAGTPKISVGAAHSKAAEAKTPESPTPTASNEHTSFGAVEEVEGGDDESPFATSVEIDDGGHEDDSPFSAERADAVISPEAEPPMAAPPPSADLESLLAGAESLVRSLEKALENARSQERALRQRLGN